MQPEDRFEEVGAGRVLDATEARLQLALEVADAGNRDLNLVDGTAWFDDRTRARMGYPPGQGPTRTARIWRGCSPGSPRRCSRR